MKKNIKMLLNNAFKPDLRVYKEAKYLQEHGCNVEILCMDRKNEYTNNPNEIYDGIKITRFYPRTERITKLLENNHIIAKLKYFIYFWWLLKFIKQVKKYLKNEDYDILHCHDIEMAFCGVTFFRKKKVVFDMHEYYLNRKSKITNWFLGKIVKYTQKRATWIIHVNNFQLEKMDKRDKEKLIYLPNYPEERKFKNLEHKKSKKLRISYIGSVFEYEPIYNLMQVSNELENIKVNINGGGPLYEQLSNISKMMKNVEFTGKFNNEDVAKYYEETDILYCVYVKGNKNHDTAIATKFYESLIARTPLMVTEGTEMAKIVLKYDIGFCIDSSDKDNIKETIKKIQNNPELLSRKIENVKKISNNYTWENVSSNLSKIYGGKDEE